MTCAQGLLRLLWGGGAESWSATGLVTSRSSVSVVCVKTEALNNVLGVAVIKADKFI